MGCQKSSSTSTSEASTLEATYTSLNTSIFQAKCRGCHTSSSDQGIDFTNYSSLVSSQNAQGGNAVVSGDPGSSRIWIRTRPGGGMPPTGALSTEENNAIGTWIQNGANP